MAQFGTWALITQDGEWRERGVLVNILLVLEDFAECNDNEFAELKNIADWVYEETTIKDVYEYIVEHCEILRQKYIETGEKDYWRALIQLLPSGWNQMRTWTADYQVLRNIYKKT